MIEKRVRHWLYGDHDAADVNARRAMHSLANEVTKLDAQVRRMKQSGDPWHELVKAIRGCDDTDREMRH